jgi:hypothetical protein
MRKLSIILLFSFIVPVVLIGWDGPEVIQAKEDTKTIFELSKPLLQEGHTSIIKWSGELAGYPTIASFQRSYNELSRQLGLQANSEIEYINGLPVLRSSRQLTNGAQLQGMYIGAKDQKSCILILKLTADSYGDDQNLVTLKREIQEKLANLNLKGNWNSMVQGILTDAELANNPEALLQRISKEVNAMEQELYVDGHTLSASLFTNKLEGSVKSGRHEVNLQIALHQNSITKEWRLTLGSPLITMEY